MNENSVSHEISLSEDDAQKFISDYGLKPAAWLGKLVTNNICKERKIFGQALPAPTVEKASHSLH
ncbi:MAG: hypothetical protein RMK89_11785 [Armatimonadota bacterium]|nr:hypothetical protein [Armatimonadota bacterium]MDW8144129.1 hypothetical protein [Armatimonadota bacterium]